MNAEDVRKAAEKLPGSCEISSHGGIERIKYNDQILAYPANHTFTEAFEKGVKRWFKRLGVIITLASMIFVVIRVF